MPRRPISTPGRHVGNGDLNRMPVTEVISSHDVCMQGARFLGLEVKVVCCRCPEPAVTDALCVSGTLCAPARLRDED